jgi:hypothetical protein
MPTYVYKCPDADCPPFECERPMAQSSEPAYCPTCAQPAPKSIVGTHAAHHILIPQHFQGHVDQVRTKENLGPGPWQDLNRRLARWNGR